jgi:hypothetical protein
MSKFIYLIVVLSVGANGFLAGLIVGQKTCKVCKCADRRMDEPYLPLFGWEDPRKPDTGAAQ